MACEQLHAQAPHAVFLPCPTQGHVIPAIEFAETLASQGFIITFVCAEHITARISKSHGSGLSPSIRLIGLPDEEQDIDQDADIFITMVKIIENMVPAFEQTVNGLFKNSKESSVPPPLCIISDFFLSWSQDIAHKFNIPRYVFFPASSSCLAVMLYLPRFIEEGIAPVAADVRDIVVPGLPPLDSYDLPSDWRQSVPQEWREYAFPSLLKIHESSGILVNTFNELEREAIDAVRTEAINPNKLPIYPLGPILPSKFFRSESIDQETLSETEKECLQWLDAQTPSSVLYISFGSLAILSMRQIQELAKALDACQQQAFLWILRLPPSATAATALPEGFLSRTHSRGLIISTWAGQLLILSHPSTGGFLTHCGWNSTLESICSGVPLLPLPQFAEQFNNSRMVTEHWKVGLKLQRGPDDVAESGEIEIGVRKLMQGHEGRAVRSRARELKEEAASAVAEFGSSHAALQAFIQAAAASHTTT
ncbi:hypothetical protein O6H91_06G136500 [Diphasiastrum complanatum]|uniref:Uncharacterized protein n=2 Tax=Diphasiastrum complanatum TaxID=34168 RepID=A0ACC2DJM6_DIPCM|nr:hypothetical protein O6H91_06G136000 [Diphasiastrum complanatum]KAJ7554354.1 hypothetical protein O6H91_06G136500 [Diphasiastrum complanatum]